MPGKRKSIPYKIKVRLLKEVENHCPFCRNEDTEHLEFHHIDENKENSVFANLLAVCPTCHSKISKNDISMEQVVRLKEMLGLRKKEREKFVPKEIKSEYPGGAPAFLNFLKENLRYPKDAIDREISGTVVVQFVVDEDGIVSDVEALSGPPELHAEAIRVVRKSYRWLPAKQNGRPVKYYSKQPIIFQLKKEKGFLESLFS
ncbi:TonB family protein [Paraflavitalea sp. CAU 1676]|uniref:TonB family protein n=1 Tax=Paraflavitalea sp. CAU 1676 TaxID=3032598 RepID=UPI0023DB06F7|nr:TonB family protein [Paraflavitalea sp. CAU 1676]MDF2188726.1 TonB family protein [Paraflavitalea sp. CAU 1676]